MRRAAGTSNVRVNTGRFGCLRGGLHVRNSIAAKSRGLGTSEGASSGGVLWMLDRRGRTERTTLQRVGRQKQTHSAGIRLVRLGVGRNSAPPPGRFNRSALAEPGQAGSGPQQIGPAMCNGAGGTAFPPDPSLVRPAPVPFLQPPSCGSSIEFTSQTSLIWGPWGRPATRTAGKRMHFHGEAAT